MCAFADMPRLDRFFHPESIAIVGASERGMYPAGIIQNLLEYGYRGRLYPVNPKRKSVFGLECHANVTEIPAPVDLAVVIVPRDAVMEVLGQCARAGVPAAIVVTSGFAEADDYGRALQKEMERLSQRSGMAIVGPNTAGLANISDGIVVTRLPAPPKPGNVSLVSQSGALMMALYGVFVDENVGMSKIIALGNQVDVSVSESLEYMVHDPQTGVIGAFVEGLRDGRRFADALRAALEAGKPVVVVKSGLTDQGRKAAATHTAALAGSGRAFAAVCDQFGALLVEDVTEMVETAKAFSVFGSLGAGGRLAVVTQSGGLGSLTADLCAREGLTLPPLDPRIEQALRRLPHILGVGVLSNPTDVRGPAVIGRATTETLAPFMEDDSTDAVLLLLAKSSVREQDAATAEAVIETFERYEKPLFVVWVGQKVPTEEVGWPLAHRMLTEAGVPLFDRPGSAVRVIANMVRYARARRAWLSDPEVRDAR